MECRAICGSLPGGGATIVGTELQLFKPGCKSWAKQGVQLKKTLLQVRAVSSAGVGRRARREQNVEGDFFVDRTCIDCDTCRWMTPTVFTRKDGQSAVHHQPTSQDERVQALQGIYNCGYHSEKAFGAVTYLITLPEGNILVDSPRYSEQLARRLDEMGGVRYMFLTHKDDVADHKQWQARFKCERILHEKEVTADTVDVETKLKGEGNWTLGPEIDLIFTPGHTQGHVALLLKDKGVLFTGDHLWANPDGVLVRGLYHKHSVAQQIDSIEALIPYDFTWILPGHGRRRQFHTVQEKNEAFAELVSRERSSK